MAHFQSTASYEPPSYASTGVEYIDEPLPGFPSPPSYTRPAIHRRRRNRDPQGAEHTFTFKDTRERPWALLRLQSCAGSASHQPKFRPGDEICGFVELDLSKEKAIQGVNVSVRGHYTPARGDLKTVIHPNGVPPPTTEGFLELRSTLWKPSMGDPRSSHFSSADGTSNSGSSTPPSRHGRSRSASPKEFKERLCGGYSFPFLVRLPSTIVTDNGIEETLPPSFCESSSPVHITYEIEITIQTALFKSDAAIKANFLVVPMTQPPFPSQARELIYNCRSSMLPPGPMEDPEGWNVSNSAVFMGSLNKTTPVGVKCTMALANPLTYTRGFTIPINLALATSSAHGSCSALLSDVSAIRICLLRKVVDGEGRKKGKVSRKESSVSCVGWGLCWPNTSERLSANRRVVNCEIKLRKDLTPSFQFRGLKVEYSVALLPFEAPNLSSPQMEPLIVVPVNIVAGRPSVTPVSNIPAGLPEPAFMKATADGSKQNDAYIRSGFAMALHPLNI